MALAPMPNPTDLPSPVDGGLTDAMRAKLDELTARANAALARATRRPCTGRPCPKATRAAVEVLKGVGEHVERSEDHGGHR